MRFALIIGHRGRGRHSASAQAPEQAQETLASAADVASMIARARSERKPDQANFIQPLRSALRGMPQTSNTGCRESTPAPERP